MRNLLITLNSMLQMHLKKKNQNTAEKTGHLIGNIANKITKNLLHNNSETNSQKEKSIEKQKNISLHKKDSKLLMI